MEFSYTYWGSSAVSSRGGKTEMSFAPDTTREPTYFDGRLRKNIAFREAISALHDVVVSDLRYQPKDRSAYQAWLEQQELLDWDAVASQRADVDAEIGPLVSEVRALQQRVNAGMSSYWRAQHRYFDYLYRRDYQAWLVLDPVITVHPDEVFFECFSKDESSYGRLGASYEVFQGIGDFACGTTNIDYSSALYNEFQKIRSYRETRFVVDPSGFEVQTGHDDTYKEVKIDLPDSWVRGFLQVSSAMSMPMTSFDLDPMDVHNICFALRRRREKKGPRALRYELRPGEPVRVHLEPWNQTIVCARSIYAGPHAEEIRVWGRRRLHILERLLPVARKFRVHLLGRGMPSFYVADLGDLSFTLGLSGWTTNNWSSSGNFDLLAPRAEVDSLTKRQVFHALRENWAESADSLSGRLGLERATVLGALGAYTQAGRAIFDLNKGLWRVRELSREPLAMDKLRFSNEREASAARLVNENKVRQLSAREVEGGATRLSAQVHDGRRHQPTMLIDADERIVEAECGCHFHRSNKLTKGPCEHLLAMRIAHRRSHHASGRGGRRT